MTSPASYLDSSELLSDFKLLADLWRDLEGHSKYLNGSPEPWAHESHKKVASAINKLSPEDEPIPDINHSPDYDINIVKWLMYLHKGILKVSELNEYIWSNEQSESQVRKLDAVVNQVEHLKVIEDAFGDESLLVDFLPAIKTSNHGLAIKKKIDGLGQSEEPISWVGKSNKIVEEIISRLRSLSVRVDEKTQELLVDLSVKEMQKQLVEAVESNREDIVHLRDKDDRIIWTMQLDAALREIKQRTGSAGSIDRSSITVHLPSLFNPIASSGLDDYWRDVTVDRIFDKSKNND